MKTKKIIYAVLCLIGIYLSVVVENSIAELSFEGINSFLTLSGCVLFLVSAILFLLAIYNFSTAFGKEEKYFSETEAKELTLSAISAMEFMASSPSSIDESHKEFLKQNKKFNKAEPTKN